MPRSSSPANIRSARTLSPRLAGAVAAMYLGAVLIGMALVSVPSSSVYLKAVHGLSDQDYGRVFLPQLLFAIAGALLGGPAVRRLSLKAMYLVALVCLLLSQLALALSASVDAAHALMLIMLCMALFGFGFGFGGGPLNGLVANLFPTRSDTAITALHLMAGVGMMVGPLFFRLFEALGTWSAAPILLLGLALALFVLAALCLPRSAQRRDSTRGPAPSASAHFWLMIGIAFLYAVVEGAFSNWAVIYVTGEKGQSADAGAAALSIFWGGLTLGRLLATLTVSRVGAFSIWVLLPVAMIASFLLIPALLQSYALLLGYGVAGLACSAFFPLMVAIAGRPYPQHISWIASMLTASLMLGVGAGSYVIGGLLETLPLSTLYRYLAVLPAITLTLMLLGSRMTGREQLHAETGYSRL
jgi:predicted MFS family arabinose efflux permease